MSKDLLDLFDIADTALVPHRLVVEERLSAFALCRDRLPDWAELQV